MLHISLQYLLILLEDLPLETPRNDISTWQLGRWRWWGALHRPLKPLPFQAKATVALGGGPAQVDGKPVLDKRPKSTLVQRGTTTPEKPPEFPLFLNQFSFPFRLQYKFCSVACKQHPWKNMPCDASQYAGPQNSIINTERVWKSDFAKVEKKTCFRLGSPCHEENCAKVKKK